MILRSLFAALLIAMPVSAQAINVGNTGVSFSPPPDFKVVPKAIADLKWPTERAPRFAVGNERATTTVAYDLKPHQIPQERLPDVQRSFTTLMERAVPGLEWKRNELIELSGQTWLLMEMTSKAIDTDIHNIMLVTGYQDQMLVFNFNSTKADFPKYEAALRTSLESIRLPQQ